MGRSVSVPPNAEVITYIDISNFSDESNGLLWHVEEIKEDLMYKYSSLTPIYDRWVGRENKVCLYNDLCYIGVSIYGSIMSLWIVPREQYLNLALTWIHQIEDSVLRWGDLIKEGTMSNGVSVYKKKTIKQMLK